MKQSFKKRFVAALVSLVLCLSFGGGQLTALAAPDTISLSTLTGGSKISFAGYNWYVLNPSSGYLFFQDLQVTGLRFDGGSNLFDPSVSTNAAYYLNNSFLSSLSSTAQSMIQTHTWGVGARDWGGNGNEASSTVDAKIGLLSYGEWGSYRSYFPVPAFGTGYWLITSATTTNYVWMVVNNGLGADYKNNYHSVRPSLYLSPSAAVSTITYNLNGGTNSASNPAAYVPGATSLTYGAPTKTGFQFLGWYDNASFSGSPVTGLTTSDSGSKELYAKWNILPAAKGTVPTQTAAAGLTCTFDASHIADGGDSDPLAVAAIVTGPDTSVATAALSSGTVTVTGVAVGSTSVTVRVSDGSGTTDIAVPITVRAKETYHIAASAGDGGSISPTGSVSVTEAEDQTFTVTPDEDHLIGSVTVDGLDRGTISSYTFSDVTDDHIIEAVFVDKYTRGTLTDQTTGISVSGGLGEEVSLEIADPVAPDPGTDAGWDAIQVQAADGSRTLLLLKDISILGDSKGPFTITFPVDPSYNGRTVTILHSHGGQLETYTATVADGKVSIAVPSLSPFAVFLEHEKAPTTADGGVPALWALLGALSLCGVAALVLKKRHSSAD